MHRRDVLASVATIATTGLLAGCATNSPAGPAETPTSHPEPTETPTPTDTPMPSITDTGFSVTGIQSGTQVNEASVSFETDRVVVTGTIAGTDGCKTAHLADADLTDGELTLTVATKDRPDAGMCTQAIVEISYEATVSFEPTPPTSVRVVHESVGETVEVASAER